MLAKYFPICNVDGPIEPPVPYGHMVSRGAVPQKCSSCPNLFEGECLRNASIGLGYSHLDHGPCGVPGATDPVLYEDVFLIAKVEIPRKCSTCRHLAVDRIFGFHCTKDAEKWGDFHRGLDWGNWEPDTILFDLPLPKITTKKLCEHAKNADLVSFIAEYRRVNPGLSMLEARKDYEHLQSMLNAATNISMAFKVK
jgi:hypothetical protein